MKTTKCYASLESYGSPAYKGKAQKICLDSTSPQIFANTVKKTPALILELCHSSLCYISVLTNHLVQWENYCTYYCQITLLSNGQIWAHMDAKGEQTDKMDTYGITSVPIWTQINKIRRK